jgi:hypothetical protein
LVSHPVDRRCEEWRRARLRRTARRHCACPASYSDLAVTKEKTIVSIYQSGLKTWNEYIAVARFDRAWVVE